MQDNSGQLERNADSDHPLHCSVIDAMKKIVGENIPSPNQKKDNKSK